ncbi:MAG: hypothetical protein IJ960_07015 [Oscillospiraceae bacterium]|nr:hypothetical protein [Oscillospiraceae bacterium]
MNQKRLIALIVCVIALMGLMRYRSQSRELLDAVSSDPEPPESVVLLDAQWPETGMDLPVPPGTVRWAMADREKGTHTVQLQSVSEEAVKEYTATLKKAGYQEISRRDEETGFSIGTVFTDGSSMVSLAYSQHTLVVTLMEQGWSTENSTLKSGKLSNVHINGYATYDPEAGVRVVTELFAPKSEEDSPGFTQVSGWVILILNGEQTVCYLGAETDAQDAVALAVSTGVTGQTGDRGTVILGGTVHADNAVGGAGSFAMSFDIQIP